jgi:hypothetical protein
VRVGQSLINGIEITYRRLSPVVLFLIPFTALWSGVSMWGIYGRQLVQGKFDPAHSLFGLPFLLGTMNRPPVSKVDADSDNRIWFAFVTVYSVKP